jgi:hypothetical protein
MAYVLQPLILRRVRHSRMLLAGIQAEFGLDPRLKHSGVTVWESHLLTPAKFSKESAKNLAIYDSKLRALRGFRGQFVGWPEASLEHVL